MLRMLRARKFDVDAAATLVQEILAYRKQHDLDGLLQVRRELAETMRVLCAAAEGCFACPPPSLCSCPPHEPMTRPCACTCSWCSAGRRCRTPRTQIGGQKSGTRGLSPKLCLPPHRRPHIHFRTLAAARLACALRPARAYTPRRARGHAPMYPHTSTHTHTHKHTLTHPHVRTHKRPHKRTHTPTHTRTHAPTHPRIQNPARVAAPPMRSTWLHLKGPTDRNLAYFHAAPRGFTQGVCGV